MHIPVDWKKSKTDVFWGEIAPDSHILQIYETHDALISTLAGFVESGMDAGDNCIVIATDTHLEALNERLKGQGSRVEALVAEERYFPIDAIELLSKFMVNGWPDEGVFMQVTGEILRRAGKNGRRARIFGEMGPLLWIQGNSKAALFLEHLGNKLCETGDYCIYCAYPRSGFTGHGNMTLNHICGAHSKMISGSEKQSAEVYYRNMVIA